MINVFKKLRTYFMGEDCSEPVKGKFVIENNMKFKRFGPNGWSEFLTDKQIQDEKIAVENIKIKEIFDKFEGEYKYFSNHECSERLENRCHYLTPVIVFKKDLCYDVVSYGRWCIYTIITFKVRCTFCRRSIEFDAPKIKSLEDNIDDAKKYFEALLKEKGYEIEEEEKANE